MKKTKNRFSKIVATGMATIMSIASIATPFSRAENAYAETDYGYKTCYINESTFPDPIFRQVIINSIDLNHDGFLSQEDIYYGRNIWCVNMGIKSLKGIEYLVELRGLYCMENELTELNVKNNKLIQGIWCSDNNLTSLDFTPNKDLEWVYFHNNQVTTVNVKNNPKMSYIEANSNPLKELDVSENKILEHLMCGDCGLKKLDLTNNPRLMHLDAFRNKFTKLDLSKNTKLKRLDIWDNPQLGNVDISMLKGLQTYNCSNNNISKLDVTHNPELNKLLCNHNLQLTALDLSKNHKLSYLDCHYCGIKKLNVSNNPMLRFIMGFINSFTELNVGDNPYILKTINEGKYNPNESNTGGAESWTIDYGGDVSTGGDNIFFFCVDKKVKVNKTPSGKAPVIVNPNQDSNIKDTSNLITREAFVKVLYEMAGKPKVNLTKSRFKDVEKGSWYYGALLWGEENSLCMGYPTMISDEFGVGKYLSRQDMVFMLMRYVEYIGDDFHRSIDFGRTDDYIDYYDIDFEHWEAMCWAATWHIMDGKPDPDKAGTGDESAEGKDEQIIDPYGKATIADIEHAIAQLMDICNLPNVDYKTLIKNAIKEYRKYAKESVNSVVEDKQSKAKYRITSNKGNLTVTYTSTKNKKVTKAVVPDNVKINGKKYKVTAIAPYAFKNNKKLKKITIGKNIRKIGKYAFYGCKNLKSIKIKTVKLKKKSIGKNAFKKINKKAKFKVPKKKLKLYKKLIKKAKAPKTVKIVK